VNQDAEHLRLLSIFHYVVAGISALFACFPLIHFVVGCLMVFAPNNFGHSGHNPGNDIEALRFFGGLFMLIAAFIIALGWTMAICIFCVGRCIARRRRYTFCFVVAAIECLLMPYGTVLGVFTIIVLMRPSVKAMFECSPFATSPKAI
jgi:hypothetical protein